ncbi:unknown [Mycoplasma sp. CAG:776]|nr:unknown [Mycoplasma sp. CAG:776]
MTESIRTELQKEKTELRNEILFRIKTGNFKEGLYPLIKNIILTEKEIEEIFACWRMEGEQSLLFLYGIILRTRDLEQIQIADKYLIGTYKQAEEMLKK